MAVTFSREELEAIASALGDTEFGLTGSEMADLLAASRMKDPSPTMTKRHRLFNAFVESQNAKQNRANILAFIRKAMKPQRFLRHQHRFEPLRANLNEALSFSGLCVHASGELASADKTATIGEATRRAKELRADLQSRGTHPDVLKFCREELLADNYFHAVLEAVKSVAEKLRTRTGLTDDGATLIDRVLGGSPPMLAINSLSTESEKSEQKGFANLVRGTFGMFRNTTAHAPRLTWKMTKDDAEDLLTIVSLIHRRLDSATRPPRPQRSVK